MDTRSMDTETTIQTMAFTASPGNNMDDSTVCGLENTTQEGENKFGVYRSSTTSTSNDIRR
jgi:hypothetical protein